MDVLAGIVFGVISTLIITKMIREAKKVSSSLSDKDDSNLHGGSEKKDHIL